MSVSEPGPRLIRSDIVVPAVLVAAITVQYKAGWNRRARSCASRLTTKIEMNKIEAAA
ncbi:Uncharacterised protein [Mycobacteroides abscessus subsp. abscessus]|nr:Uncharacterised protein [Mycobacteroides abscessus subsp. abscessus]